MIRLIKLAVVLSSAVVISWWQFEQVDRPWGWFAGTWAIFACLTGSLARSNLIRVFWFNAAAALLAVGGAEIWLSAQSGARESHFEGRYTEDYYVNHDLLGYAPAKGGQFSSRRFVGGEKVYDTCYSINLHGLRITPVPLGAKPEKSVLFFGGSFTFGEGVADSESMPYRVGELVNSSFQVYNFGFHGYGPHQMLATLEFGLYADVVTERVSYVIYQALKEHVARVRGLAPWDQRGPWYTRNRRGEIEYAGTFADSRSRLLNRFLPVLERSRLYERFFGLQRAWTTEDVDIYIAVVARARDLAKELFPGSEFHVLFWDKDVLPGEDDDGLSGAILDGFAEVGIQTHLISHILPDYQRTIRKYLIREYEPHPNALAHDMIARYVVKEILSEHE